MEILDDVRFLTLSITSRQGDSSSSKIKSTATCKYHLALQIGSSKSSSFWILFRQDTQSEYLLTTLIFPGLHNRLLSLPTPLISPDTPPDLIIFSAVLLTAKIYSSSISTSTPTSSLYTPLLLIHLQSYISLVGLARWKEMPGIFLWTLLVACPGVGEDHQGRFLRRKMAVTGMSIGMEDFGLAISQLKAFWKVQRWVARERERDRIQVNRDSAGQEHNTVN
jgi:hypothetical protein